MIKIEFYSLKFWKTTFLQLRVNGVAVFKTFKLLLNLFQRDGPINEILFWRKLLSFKGISKAICDLMLYIFLEGQKVHLRTLFWVARIFKFWPT